MSTSGDKNTYLVLPAGMTEQQFDRNLTEFATKNIPLPERLYGLVSFMAVQRSKEAGIRKTLRASAPHIVYFFSKEFTVLIVIALALSSSVAWYCIHAWLQDFVYRIDIGPLIFVLAIFSSVLIA